MHRTHGVDTCVGMAFGLPIILMCIVHTGRAHGVYGFVRVFAAVHYSIISPKNPLILFEIINSWK